MMFSGEADGMADRARVFLASSSEGLEVTTAVRRLLLGELGESAELQPWTRAFELSATYIESLERVAAQADFAVLVLTSDDVTTSRKKRVFSPRDNVVFELGLFMGGLGRERCFLVQEDRPDLKLPSDLLGVNTATFPRPAGGDLKVALAASCARIAERITELGARHKLSAELGTARTAVRALLDRLKGAWWERISRDGKHWLSFMQLDVDALHDSAQMRGTSYDAEGTLLAHWSSLVARVSGGDRRILYHWQGWYPENPQASPQDRFHGFGELEFELPRETGGPIVRGLGRYWDVDEAHPERTVVKSVQLRRIEDHNVVAAMAGGKDKDVRTAVLKALRDW